MAERRRRPGALPILVARFCYFCMEIGLTKSFGVLIPDFEEQLQTSNAIIGLVTSLSLATMYLGCPIAKVILHRCKHRRLLTTVCGLGAGCALICTSLTRNVLTLCLLFLIMGLCCAIINLQLIVLLFDYYQEDFPFASCISVFGIPFGAVFLPPLTEKFLELYGLSGSLMVIGAFTLNMVPIGLVLKEKRSSSGAPIEDKESNNPLLEYTKLEDGGRCASKDAATAEDFQLQITECQVIVGGSSGTDEGVTVMNASSNCNTTHAACKDISGDSAMEATPCFEGLAGPSANGQISGSRGDHTACGDRYDEQCETSYNDRHDDDPSYDRIQTVCPLDDSSQERRDCREWSVGQIFISALEFIHFDVLIKEPLFSLLYLSSCLLVFVVIGGWALFVVLYAVEHGIELGRAAYLPTSGAVGGVLSSILISFVLLYRPKWSTGIYVASVIISAVFLFLQTMYDSYTYLVVMSFFIGFGLFGANDSAEAVMSQIVSPENFSDASNIFLFAVGIGYVLSGYVSGYVQDKTGDTEVLFRFFGVTLVVAIVLLFMLLFALRRRHTKKSVADFRGDDETKVDVGRTAETYQPKHKNV